MLIYIVRHGLTEWNKLKKLQGAADVPLAKEGILLAEKTGEALRNVKFDICFTSPLSRAKQTAEYVLGKRDVPIIPDKRIPVSYTHLDVYKRQNKGSGQAGAEGYGLF